MNISDLHKKNRIQVSNTKKPLFFYVNLAKVPLSLSLFQSVFLCVYICFPLSLGLPLLLHFLSKTIALLCPNLPPGFLLFREKIFRLQVFSSFSTKVILKVCSIAKRKYLLYSTILLSIFACVKFAVFILIGKEEDKLLLGTAQFNETKSIGSKSTAGEAMYYISFVE